jgi:hypothetical protein
VSAQTSLPDLIAAMRVHAARLALVVEGDARPPGIGQVKGLVRRDQIAEGVLEALESDEN